MTSLWWDLSCWPLVGVLRATSPWLNPQALLLLRGYKRVSFCLSVKLLWFQVCIRETFSRAENNTRNPRQPLFWGKLPSELVA